MFCTGFHPPKFGKKSNIGLILAYVAAGVAVIFGLGMIVWWKCGFKCGKTTDRGKLFNIMQWFDYIRDYGYDIAFDYLH